MRPPFGLQRTLPILAADSRGSRGWSHQSLVRRRVVSTHRFVVHHWVKQQDRGVLCLGWVGGPRVGAAHPALSRKILCPPGSSDPLILPAPTVPPPMRARASSCRR